MDPVGGLLRPTLRIIAAVLALASIWVAGQTPAAESPGPSVGPQVIRFSGVLKYPNGEKVRPGVHGVMFSLYSEPDPGPAPLWSEEQNVTVGTSGAYTVFLGSTSPNGFPLSLLPPGESRFLGVRLEEQHAEELPRVLFASVPYAMEAADAQNLAGQPASQYVTTQQLAAAFVAPPDPINAAAFGGMPPSAFEQLAHKAAPNGYASLDASGLLPASQLPLISSSAPHRGDVLVWNGQNYVPQPKAVFEVRDYDGAGVDCTGLTDSSAFLNSLTGTPNGSSFTISTRGCPFLRADGWVIQGQEYLELDLGPMGPATQPQGGTWLFGCSGSGAVLRIDSSGYTKIHGGVIATNSYKCPGHTSTLTSSIRYTNSGTGGFTSTHNTLADTMLTSGVNGEATAGYHAYEIIGSPNQEEFRLNNVVILCNGSPNSVGFYSNDQNADSTTWDGGGATWCYRMIQVDAGRLRLLHTNNSYNGTFSIFGAGGASIAQSAIGCVTEIVENVFAEGSGTLIRSSTGGTFPCNNYLRGNQASPSDVDSSAHFIETGFQIGALSLEQNNFSIGCSPSILDNAVVGSVPDGGTGQVVVYDRGGNNLTNCAQQTYQLTSPALPGGP